MRVGSTTNVRVFVAAVIATGAMAAPAAPAEADPCDPDSDPECLPTREECAEGGYDGLRMDPARVLPGSLCVSAGGEEGVFVAGDPTICGTVAVAGTTLIDTADGDPNDCTMYPVGTVRESGYLTARDGTKLRYVALRPDDAPRVPVAITVTPYGYGVEPSLDMIGRALLDAGYAVMGVDSRGASCSEGAYYEWRRSDMYDLVEFAAARPWATGDVGMYGVSAGAITQLLAAEAQPPSLRAIAPSEFITHRYRQFSHPGGIYQYGFDLPYHNGYRQQAAATYPTAVVEDGDVACLENQADGGPTDPLRTGPRRTHELEHPYIDEADEAGFPGAQLDRIEVPVLSCQTWQDDMLLAEVDWVDQVTARDVWTVFTNGYHGACSYTPLVRDLTVRFFDAFVHPDRHANMRPIPRVQILHESTDFATTSPSWITSHRRWPPRTETRAFHLGAGTLLDGAAPEPGATSYTYPLSASSMDADNVEQEYAAWRVPPVPGGYATWTTPPLEQDVEIFGPGSLDLWLSSTAPDTDLQVTLTEVRPDGQEAYLRRGWLRASHRALDEVASTVVRPVHTHREEDAAPLPGEPTPVRVKIPAVNHVFRAGSSLRVIVDAPTGRTGWWQFAFEPTPAVNTIHHGPDHPSRLVLGVIPGGAAPADRPLPACGTVLSNPCRDNPLPVPDGSSAGGEPLERRAPGGSAGAPVVHTLGHGRSGPAERGGASAEEGTGAAGAAGAADAAANVTGSAPFSGSTAMRRAGAAPRGTPHGGPWTSALIALTVACGSVARGRRAARFSRVQPWRR